MLLAGGTVPRLRVLSSCVRRWRVGSVEVLRVVVVVVVVV